MRDHRGPPPRNRTPLFGASLFLEIVKGASHQDRNDRTDTHEKSAKKQKRELAHLTASDRVSEFRASQVGLRKNRVDTPGEELVTWKHEKNSKSCNIPSLIPELRAHSQLMSARSDARISGTTQTKVKNRADTSGEASFHANNQNNSKRNTWTTNCELLRLRGGPKFGHRLGSV